MKFWCGTAFMNTSEMPAVAQMLDTNGYHGILVSDHLVYPKHMKTPYPATPDGKLFWPPETEWPDAWVLIGAMAAVTTDLHFGNNVYIAPSRPLLEVAKQVATAAAIAQGRVSIGLSAGWMRDEFELLGQDFDNRGRRLDEMVDALRALWQGGWVSWQGEFYDIQPITQTPAPTKPIPILVGGHSEAALRRAAVRGDGWMHGGGPNEDLDDLLLQLDKIREQEGVKDKPFEIHVISLDGFSVDGCKRLEDKGVTDVIVGFRLPYIKGPDTEPLADKIAHLEKFAEKVIAKVKG